MLYDHATDLKLPSSILPQYKLVTLDIKCYKLVYSLLNYT